MQPISTNATSGNNVENNVQLFKDVDLGARRVGRGAALTLVPTMGT